ncbi:hypothetical protein AB0M95_27630 [Sphaerisporangium sp. NPDC051017]|uniref:hypothetical protein n=1 Tax=Sphaerisporangium sp. NPDC051017 TaxID=3154636 RepID=UPI003413F31A
MEKIRMRTPGGKTVTWTQTHHKLFVGILECDGCALRSNDRTLTDAERHAESCRVISVERI